MAATAHPAAISAARVVGRSALRLEDPPLLTGKGSFLGDLSFPRSLHMLVVRSAMLMEGSLRSIPRRRWRRWRRRGSSRCGPRATPRIFRRSVCAGIGTQRANVFRLTPYLQPALARARCAMSESRLMHSRS